MNDDHVSMMQKATSHADHLLSISISKNSHIQHNQHNINLNEQEATNYASKFYI